MNLPDMETNFLSAHFSCEYNKNVWGCTEARGPGIDRVESERGSDVVHEASRGLLELFCLLAGPVD